MISDSFTLCETQKMLLSELGGLGRHQQSVQSHRQTIAAKLSAKTGLTFGVADLGSGDILPGPIHDLCLSIDSPICEALQPIIEPRLYTDRHGLVYLAVPIPGEVQSDGICLALAVQPHAECLEHLRDRVLGAGWSLHDWDRWLNAHSHLNEDLLERLLNLATESLRSEVLMKRSAAEADSLAEQVNLMYEQINLMQGLIKNSTLSNNPAELATAGVSELVQTVEAEGCGIFISTTTGEPCWVTAGMIPNRQAWLQTLLAKIEDHDWPKLLIFNRRPDEPDLDLDPMVRNLLVCPISTSSQTVGWIVCINSRSGHEFGSVEGRLVSSVASVFSAHVQNVLLFHENSELVVSLVQSLVSTIDAKDPYTRGHSVRVALVARRIAAELGLGDHELETIYLSGLLHDIGKIGVDDAILRKPSALTDEEFAAIKLHPSIGHDILENIPNMQPILAGVLHHHESYDGSGYPHRLKGENIPRIARILAVADAFDAMGSDRPYRRGMDFDTVFGKLTQGAGTQWDSGIVQTLLSIRQEIETVWSAAEGHFSKTTDAAPRSGTVKPL